VKEGAETRAEYERKKNLEEKGRGCQKKLDRQEYSRKSSKKKEYTRKNEKIEFGKVAFLNIWGRKKKGVSSGKKKDKTKGGEEALKQGGGEKKVERTREKK